MCTGKIQETIPAAICKIEGMNENLSIATSTNEMQNDFH